MSDEIKKRPLRSTTLLAITVLATATNLEDGYGW